LATLLGVRLALIAISLIIAIECAALFMLFVPVVHDSHFIPCYSGSSCSGAGIEANYTASISFHYLNVGAVYGVCGGYQVLDARNGINFCFANTSVVLPAIWEERCSTAYISPSFPNAGSICAEYLSPVTLPATFNMSSLVQSGEGGTDFTYYFGVVLTSNELVRVSMNSNNYVNFGIYFDNRTGYDTNALANEVQNNGLILFGATDTEFYDHQMTPYDGSGLYICELSVTQPTPIATVTFDIRSLTN